ncbi:hypothetical protein IIA16_05195 [bacterium]|nr:hypothetical protein [bacterium]
MRFPFRLSLLLLVAVIACRAEAKAEPLADPAATSEPVAAASEPAGPDAVAASPESDAPGSLEEEPATGTVGDRMEAGPAEPKPAGQGGDEAAAAVEETVPEPAVEEDGPDDPAVGMSDEELAGGSGAWVEAKETGPKNPAGPPPIPGLEDLGAPPLSMDAETMIGLLLGLPMAYDTPAAKTRYTDPATILEHGDALSLTPAQVDLLEVIAKNALAAARERGAALVETERSIDSWLREGGREQELVDLLSSSAVSHSILRAVHLLARVRGTSILSPEQGLVLDRIMGWESPVPASRVSIVPN